MIQTQMFRTYRSAESDRLIVHDARSHRRRENGEMEVSINGFTVENGWLMRGNPIEMDDDWGYPHLSKPPNEKICWIQTCLTV